MNTVDFLFNVINFAVLVALLWFAVRKYVLPGLAEKWQNQVRMRLSLREGIDEAATHLQQIKKEQRAQDEFCVELEKKAKFWQGVVAAELLKEQAENERLAEEILARRKQQEDAHAVERLKKQVFPKAVDQARVLLVKDFEDPAVGKAYIEDVLRSIARGRHHGKL